MTQVVPSTGDPDTDPLFAWRSGSCEPWTADVITAIAQALQPLTIVETGTFEGLTTERLATVQGAHVYSIELDIDRYERAKARFTGYPNVTISQGDALDALQSFEDESVDFIFLDDNHTSSHVASEILEAKRILKAGGVCVVHDVYGPFGLSSVVRLAGGICLPFVKLHAAGGLGVLVK